MPVCATAAVIAKVVREAEGELILGSTAPVRAAEHIAALRAAGELIRLS